MNNLDHLKKRINIKTIGAVIIILILILTFVSKTVYNYNLPVVTATTPLKGKLDKLEMVKGIAECADKVEVYTDNGGNVEEIFVKQGDYVKMGQPIARLSLSKEEISQNREKSYELQQVKMDIKNIENDCRDLKMLYEAGAVPRGDYDKVDRELQSLYVKRQKLMLEYQDLSQSESMTIYAPDNIMVSELSVHEGQKVNSGELIAKCGLSEDFKINCSIALENNFIVEGDKCKLENSSHSFEGTVNEVKAEEGNKTVSVLIKSDKVKAGETFDVKFEKKSSESHTLVPNGTLNKDSDGYFVYQIKQRKGMLGEEFYVEKLKVYIGDNDNENTIITKGITFFEPVVLLCNKEILAGDTVILENEGDFFAK
ncbi:efflux RND transporter periplasmic adaptor subunit [Anaerovorax odorimutans]|uniref:efflux RND transporter periplasmic adaptor subunit n=1 Tax=Anaerovorax odorimutans TaxID=109327 RepID=UPI000414B374|nr:biotin/lipoyl-binding protein [Anaerovorax odorimutans]